MLVMGVQCFGGSVGGCDGRGRGEVVGAGGWGGGGGVGGGRVFTAAASPPYTRPSPL